MRPLGLSQIARVAIVVPPRARLGSVGMLVDCFEMTRSHIWRHYSAIDVLSQADHFGVSTLRLLSVNAQPPKTEGGIGLPVHAGLDDGPFDVVAVADHAAPPDEVEGGDWLPQFTAWLARQHASGAIVAANGASVGYLAATGLADGSTLCAPPWLVEGLSRRWPRVRFDSGRETIEQNNILSGRGGAADLAVAVRLVETVTSRNTGRWLAAHLGVADALEPAGGLPGSLLDRAQEWLADRYSQSITINELAAAMEVDRRTLHRHFVRGTGVSPASYLLSLRIEAAKRMLERSSFPIERIAALVGFSDAGHFRRAFRKRTDTSPRQWRQSSRLTARLSPM